MDKARDLRSNQEYTAQEVADLDPSSRRALKLHLRCPYCEATAHFRSASRPSPGRRSKVAHFYALPHADECDITRSYGDPWEDDDSDRTVAHWEQRNTKLIVLIPSLTAESDDITSEDQEGPGEESRSRSSGDGTRRSNTVSRGPQKLLEQLVEWPSFKTSSMTIRMPGNDRPEVAVHDAFVRFESAIMAHHTGRWLGFWGIVRPWKLWTAHDTYYCNFGTTRESFRIALLRDHIPSILARYGLSSIDEMVGHYLLLFDYARESGSGRFMADINSVHHIGFLRNDQSS
ncbi:MULTISPECIES: hypothetical protein [Xanthomonas]|uniref:Uncharacterized protein n=1 Tax=Xanthomonas rydalmerensis TaxID=3046274 RepID=A0ABZ0JRG9_9XANT|nr:MULTISPECIES: hypothetical protein [unclassified Xanthomonas]MXV07488.1 hypothetical protein [Xanthomonas sp. LMG 9002]WOS41908.1 hypothetical protein QN243_05465 [Xanthomonas sp. DM-2023]WOS46094.1 hypothetical protein QN242_05465 [Xanthomonas sp. DM-2023]WOS50272.1 hypothetical protein QN240_05465 [Xanthomonas sp. DM-2023]WOS54452.1 hypothetical protein QN244_05465 [Xanthomonas sp. DM-2023]